MPRCPNGSRKDKKTGNCVKVGTQTKRCPKGTRKNKKTGNCEENKSVKKSKDNESVLKKELNDDYNVSYKFVRNILYNYMLETIDNMNEEKNFGGEDEDGTDIHISKKEFNEFIDKNIKSIHTITKRVDNKDSESDMVDEIRPFFKKIDELIDSHEQ